ncbi:MULTISPECIES: hypothetical protein [Pseudomonas]|uniref:hypothetical protein n=1 Tax=Pseudomonas TaxID=286 RepID=UPI002096A1E0|nr:MULTISPECIES: hypothetical protein [Pseudomonas]MCO7575244.1 hypothetical protein [Pseudomonas protegens]MCO7582653.1 hypothetical protein [Pseudomonas chlororaphis]MCO7599168.1 hypothetical protein [Pseudomonas chlororaphis]UZE35171.1 hypothetical protein LOY69_01260 [Pseudomonas sp. B21-059]
MHTTIIITFGLILLALVLFIGERLGFARQTLGYGFTGLWLALTVINGAVGMVTAHQSLRSELMVGSLVFAVPVLALVLYLLFTRA